MKICRPFLCTLQQEHQAPINLYEWETRQKSMRFLALISDGWRAAQSAASVHSSFARYHPANGVVQVKGNECKRRYPAAAEFSALYHLLMIPCNVQGFTGKATVLPVVDKALRIR